MKPVGPLMIEHRLIERMIRVLSKEKDRLEFGKQPDSELILMAVDFFRTYADRTHHGKEEDILFRDMRKKPLSDGLRKIMDELVREHVTARETVKALLVACERHSNGDLKALGEIRKRLKTLIDLYTSHIGKEDEHFFMPSMDYFTAREQENMLKEFSEFDKKMIHEKYSAIIGLLEKAD